MQDGGPSGRDTLLVKISSSCLIIATCTVALTLCDIQGVLMPQYFYETLLLDSKESEWCSLFLIIQPVAGVVSDWCLWAALLEPITSIQGKEGK